jgi:hypothetical protein
MQTTSFIVLLLGVSLSVSCSRTPSAAPLAEERSIEQRVVDMERNLNSSASRLSEAEALEQHEHDLAEIQSMGLVERAQRDIAARLPNATVEKWSIGYVFSTNTVWCDVRYRLPGGSETLQQEFGYTRKSSTNWNLIWGAGAQ